MNKPKAIRGESLTRQMGALLRMLEAAKIDDMDALQRAEEEAIANRDVYLATVKKEMDMTLDTSETSIGTDPAGCYTTTEDEMSNSKGADDEVAKLVSTLKKARAEEPATRNIEITENGKTTTIPVPLRTSSNSRKSSGTSTSLENIHLTPVSTDVTTDRSTALSKSGSGSDQQTPQRKRRPGRTSSSTTTSTTARSRPNRNRQLEEEDKEEDHENDEDIEEPKHEEDEEEDPMLPPTTPSLEDMDHPDDIDMLAGTTSSSRRNSKKHLIEPPPPPPLSVQDDEQDASKADVEVEDDQEEPLVIAPSIKRHPDYIPEEHALRDLEPMPMMGMKRQNSSMPPPTGNASIHAGTDEGTEVSDLTLPTVLQQQAPPIPRHFRFGHRDVESQSRVEPPSIAPSTRTTQVEDEDDDDDLVVDHTDALLGRSRVVVADERLAPFAENDEDRIEGATMEDVMAPTTNKSAPDKKSLATDFSSTSHETPEGKPTRRRSLEMDAKPPPPSMRSVVVKHPPPHTKLSSLFPPMSSSGPAPPKTTTTTPSSAQQQSHQPSNQPQQQSNHRRSVTTTNAKQPQPSTNQSPSVPKPTRPVQRSSSAPPLPQTSNNTTALQHRQERANTAATAADSLAYVTAPMPMLVEDGREEMPNYFPAGTDDSSVVSSNRPIRTTNKNDNNKNKRSSIRRSILGSGKPSLPSKTNKKSKGGGLFRISAVAGNTQADYAKKKRSSGSSGSTRNLLSSHSRQQHTSAERWISTIEEDDAEFGLSAQRTGGSLASHAHSLGLSAQRTGGSLKLAGLSSQMTGASLPSHRTGGLSAQRTGGSLVLTAQRTGGSTTQASGLSGQRSGGSTNRHHHHSATAGENVDLDKITATMGQDIDYIFRELSALEKEQLPTDVLAPENDDDDDGSVMSVNKDNVMGATAKIKYTLGNVTSTLRRGSEHNVTKTSGGAASGTNHKASATSKKRDADAARASTQELLSSSRKLRGGTWGAMKSPSDELNSTLSSGGPSTGATTVTTAPLLIDEDGFIISEGGTMTGDGPKAEDAFSPFAADLHGSGTSNAFGVGLDPAPSGSKDKRTTLSNDSISPSSSNPTTTAEAPPSQPKISIDADGFIFSPVPNKNQGDVLGKTEATSSSTTTPARRGGRSRVGNPTDDDSVQLFWPERNERQRGSRYRDLDISNDLPMNKDGDEDEDVVIEKEEPETTDTEELERRIEDLARGNKFRKTTVRSSMSSRDQRASTAPTMRQRRATTTATRASLTQRSMHASISNPSPTALPSPSKESRIEAVEAATKRRIDMLRKLVAQRDSPKEDDDDAGHLGTNGLQSTLGGKERASLNSKLDFLEEETMKQIKRLKARLNSSSDIGSTATRDL